MENYDVDYFIKKFEAIPEERWCTGYYHKEDRTKFCALGHCGRFVSDADSIESLALRRVFHPAVVSIINDNGNIRYSQATPKQRILAALYDIKAKQQPEIEPVKERIIYVTVDAAVRKLQKEISEN